MKYIFLSLLILSVLVSCGDDQNSIDEEIILAYLSENNIAAQKSSDGIYFIIDKVGNSEFPNINSVVTVNYKGYFLDGTVFDSGQNIDFGLWMVIDGWSNGIPLFSKGGSGTLFIPSRQAYGSSGQGSIPGNTVLAFDIDLIDFN